MNHLTKPYLTRCEIMKMNLLQNDHIDSVLAPCPSPATERGAARMMTVSKANLNADDPPDGTEHYFVTIRWDCWKSARVSLSKLPMKLNALIGGNYTEIGC